MSKTTRPDILPIVGSACQGLFGASVAWFLTSALAGVIPIVATRISEHGIHLEDMDWMLLFAWIGHVAVASIALWGLVAVIVHGLCLSALVHGTHNVFKILAVIFLVQLTTSTIIHPIIVEEEPWPAAIAGLLIATIVAASWSGLSRRPLRIIVTSKLLPNDCDV